MDEKTIYDPRIHNRRSIRLKGYDYTRSGAYFITICTHHRECLFGEIENGQMRLNEIGEIVQTWWQWLGSQYEYVGIDRFVVMPNHIHGILILRDNWGGLGDARRGGSRTAPTSQPPRPSYPGQHIAIPKTRKSVGRLIGAYKTVSSKQINQIRGTPGAQVWQRNYNEQEAMHELLVGRIRLI